MSNADTVTHTSASGSTAEAHTDDSADYRAFMEQARRDAKAATNGLSRRGDSRARRSTPRAPSIRRRPSERQATTDLPSTADASTASASGEARGRSGNPRRDADGAQ